MNESSSDVNYVGRELPEQPPANPDTFLSNAMLNLSVQDRNEIQEEIHGVFCMAKEETPSLLKQSLLEMSIALERIPQAEKKSYIRSRQLFPHTTYSIDDNWRLRMLRAEFFDVTKAAIRLCMYMDFIMEIFGQDRVELLERPIHIRDLEEDNETYRYLRSGLLQLSSYRDRSGRRIMILFLTKEMLAFNTYAKLRVYAYIWLISSNDAESQRKGIVGIGIGALQLSGANFSFKMPSKEERILRQKWYSACPTRICSIHACFPDTFLYHFGWKILALTVGEKNKRRLKFNMGRTMEMKYDLMSYGIGDHHIPATETGNIKVKNHLQWIQARKLIDEKQYTEDSIIECPALNDVVFKQAGKSWRLHPGDVYFRSLIESKHIQHLNSNQTEKKEVIWSIVEEIESRNGRFLIWDKRGWWFEVKERVEVRKKVAIALRNFNSQHKKAQQKRQFCESSTHVIFNKKRKEEDCSGCYFINKCL